jgi:hypothetical protein
MIRRDVLHEQVTIFFMAHAALANGMTPSVGLRHAIAVRRAVQHHGRNAIEVRFGNALDEGHIRDRAEALVVQNHIITLRPIRVLVDADLVIPALLSIGSFFVNDGELHIGAGTDALGEDELLLLVVVAAAAGDHEDLERLLGRENGGESCKGSGEDELHWKLKIGDLR